MPASKPNAPPSSPPSHLTPAPTSGTSTAASLKPAKTAPTYPPAAATTNTPPKVTPLEPSSTPAASMRKPSIWPKTPRAGGPGVTGKEAEPCAQREAAAEVTYKQAVVPEAGRLDETITDLEARRAQLHRARGRRTAWLEQHPEAARRLNALDRELHPLPELPEIQALGQMRAAAKNLDLAPPAPDLGIDLGL